MYVEMMGDRMVTVATKPSFNSGKKEGAGRKEGLQNQSKACLTFAPSTPGIPLQKNKPQKTQQKPASLMAKTLLCFLGDGMQIAMAMGA